MSLLVFDLDGTIVDSSELVMESFSYVVDHFGLNAEEVNFEESRAMTPRMFFAHIIGEQKSSEAFDLLAEYFKKNVHRTRLFEGIGEMLSELIDRGDKLAIWTGRDVRSATQILEFTGVATMFSQIVGGCLVERNKPDPQGLHLLSNKTSIESENFTVIGDHPHDIEGGRSVGATTVGVKWSSERRQGFGNIQPDYQFDQVSGLHEWLLAAR